MATQHQFVNSVDELITSTLEFYYKPEFYREVMRSGPKYFVHFEKDDVHIFGLSKFCAFKSITVEEYIAKYRYKTGGATTQKHIASTTKQPWVERKKISKGVRNSFDKWISGFFPGYQLDNASFITLSVKSQLRKSVNRQISLNELLEKLKIKEKIGRVGEEIALRFEIQRLKANGIKNPDTRVVHISLENAAAGYDIYSSSKSETRYIEVKSSMNREQEFFISENEVQTLSTLGKDAYVYLVHIKNLAKKTGEVYMCYKNPIQEIKNNGILKPVLYRAKIINSFLVNS